MKQRGRLFMNRINMPGKAAEKTRNRQGGQRCMDLYIYYRVRCDDAERFRARAIAIQEALARDCSIHASLKRRPQAADGRHTWMEVYLDVPGDFDAALAAALADSGLTDLIDGERHHEYFMDMSACA
jgi:hypothetical protein